MGFFSEDMVGMLGVYESETSELISSIEGIASRVEQSSAFAPEDVAELFRCAHTIKGSSAMMGLEDLSLLTHKFEDLFDLLRTDPSLVEGHEHDFLDYLYAFIDYTKDELDRMENDDYAPADVHVLIDELVNERARLVPNEEAVLGKEQIESDAQPSESGAAQGDDAGGTTLKVNFKPDVPMVNARALVILRQLGKKVRLLSHVPEDLMDPQSGEAISNNGLFIRVDDADADKTKQLLAKNTTVRRITVLENTRVVPSAPEATKERASTASASSDKFITLRWDRVHDLQNLAGEFLLHTSTLQGLLNSSNSSSEIRAAMSHTTRLVNDLVYRINAMAMVSMSAMVPQLSRMVRDIRRASGKQLSFEVHGGDIDIDRNLYNSISEPLLHIIRNAVDHGIESPEERLAVGKEARGKVVLSVEDLGARVAFRISDDGRGVDTAKVLAKAEEKGMLTKPADQYTHDEALELIMMAGLSTNNEVTQYSGRGVGMDVVQTVIRDFDGRAEIHSELGKGTSITLYMPVSVTSVESLGFRIGPSIYHMPLFNLEKIYAADDIANDIERYVYVLGETDEYGETYEENVLLLHQKQHIPVLNMHHLLGCNGEDAFYIVCHSMEDTFAIGVDEVIGEFTCANKPLPTCFDHSWQNACAIRNAAIMENGVVGFALNAALLAAKAQGRETQHLQAAEEEATQSNNYLYEVVTADAIPEQGLLFTLGNSRYTIPVERVERLIPLPFCAHAPLPLPFLVGLTNYRNRAIAVFDLAKAAGVAETSPYVLVVSNKDGDLEGLTVTSVLGVRSLREAALADEQPQPRTLTGNLRTAAMLKLSVKEPPVMLLTHC